MAENPITPREQLLNGEATVGLMPEHPLPRSNITHRQILQSLFDDGFSDVEMFQVKIRGSKFDIPQGRLLDFFWRDGAETLCMVCQGDFHDDRGPPIRTFSFGGDGGDYIPRGEGSLQELSKLVIEVHNRHLKCLARLHIPFFPVSHVWHQEVADAHLSKTSSIEAVTLAWFIPIRVLYSAARTMGHTFTHMEIWHDYLSVPQWNSAVQQSLLVYLPAIFKAGSACLIHLDDIPHSIIKTSFNQNSSARQVVESMCKFFDSHWFRRLWVTLEYISCTQACFITQEGYLIQMDDDNYLDSFTVMATFFRNHTRSVYIREGVGFQKEFFRKYPRQFAPLFYIRDTDRSAMALGEAYNLISRLDCRIYRDRFVAIVGLLRLGDYSEVSNRIPSDTTAACYWVLWRCLERGDYTPLLLLPIGEKDCIYAKWLRGHENITSLMWTAGKVRLGPENLNIICDGQVKPTLEYVGSIEAVRDVGFTLQGDPLQAFKIVVSFLLSENSVSNPADFVNALLRIYAVPPYMTANSDVPDSYEEYCATTPDFREDLARLVMDYEEAIPESDPLALLDICKALVTILRFDRVYGSNIGAYDRLSYAASSIESRFYSDVVARVRCSGCSRAFVFRLSLYKAYDVGWASQRVYRIPGLTCVGYPGNGMGLVMAGTLIRGRMTSGTPACSCSIREQILIQ